MDLMNKTSYTIILRSHAFPSPLLPVHYAFTPKPIENTKGTKLDSRGVVAGRADGPPIFKIVGFSEILMFRRKIFGLLLLVKIEGMKHFLAKRKFV